MSQNYFQNRILQIIIAVLLPFVFAFIFGYGSSKNMYPWLDTLVRPSFSPPKWIFGPVWTYLYASMGYASFRVFDTDKISHKQVPLVIYIIQLIVNVTWPQVYFNWHLLGFGAIHILVLLALVYLTGILFFRADRIAGFLIIPYAMWLTFASVLCVTTWRLNS